MCSGGNPNGNALVTGQGSSQRPAISDQGLQLRSAAGAEGHLLAGPVVNPGPTRVASRPQRRLTRRYAEERSRDIDHIENPIDAERSWRMIHADVGPILLGVWYRPPDASDVHTSSLAAELQRLSKGMAGTIVVGDMNIHHARWLRFPNGTTGISQFLQDLCVAEGIAQCVHEPPRGDYLFGSVLSDIRIARQRPSCHQSRTIASSWQRS